MRAFITLMLLLGCGRTSLIASPGDAGDADVDDVGRDTGTDAGTDTGTDTSTDAGIESGTDVSLDADRCNDDLVLENTWPAIGAEVDDVPIGAPVVGEVFGGGTPELVFIAVAPDLTTRYLRILNLDGESVRIDLGGVMSAEEYATPSIGDVDDDGHNEIIVIGSSWWPGAVHRRKRIIAAYEANGDLAWVFVDPEWTWGVHGAASIADLDADGHTEVILGSVVLDGHDGRLLRRGPIDGTSGGGVQLTAGPQSCVGDLDADGRLEIVAGNSVFESDGRLRWTASEFEDGFCGIADLLPAPGMEVVLLSDGYVRVLSGDRGELLWSRQMISWFRPPFGSPPTIADYDQDGWPEIVVAGFGRIAIYDPTCLSGCVEDGVLRVIEGRGGASGFDFNLDGVPEIVIGSGALRVVDAASTRFDRPRYQESSYFHGVPIVVDIDGDGEAEIITLGADRGDASPVLRILVWGHAEHGWPGARPIWNQRTFESSQVADDGSLTLESSHDSLRVTPARPRPGAGTCIDW